MSSRRDVLQALVGLSVAAIAAAAGLPVALRKMFDDASEGVPDILYIRSGQTQTVSSTDCNSYLGIEWEQTGVLAWEDGGCIQLEDTA